MIIEPVELTSAARHAVQEIMAQKNISSDYGLRIFVVDQGISCGATNYSLGFDKASERDLVYKAEELLVIVKKVEAVHLAGLTLDYVTEEGTSGFAFNRPN
jgi:iron-sulfur cluster assembly accessory protein